MGKSGVIIKKELTRVFGDKKLVFSLFILPAVVVIGMYALMGQLAENMSRDIKEHISAVYVVNAPAQIKNLAAGSGYGETANIEWLAAPSEARLSEIKDAILTGGAELLVVFEERFEEKAAAYKELLFSSSAQENITPQLTLYYNTTGNYSAVAKNNFESFVLAPYQQMMLAERLGNLELLTVFDMQTVVIVDEDKASGEGLAMMIPYLITMLLFAGAMSLCVDAVTGEKERGTMASMLLTPIKRSELVFGKLVSLSLLSAISAIVSAVSMIAAMPMMMESLMGGGEAGVSLHFSGLQVAEMICIMVTLVYLYVALVSLVAVAARTAKEASTYVTPLYMIVLVLGMITMFQGGQEKSLGMFAVPVYGSALSIQNLMTNELTLTQFGCTAAGNLVLAVVLTFLITKAFNSEKIMFNA